MVSTSHLLGLRRPSGWYWKTSEENYRPEFVVPLLFLERKKSLCAGDSGTVERAGVLRPKAEELLVPGCGRMGPRSRWSPWCLLAPSPGSCLFLLFCLHLGASCPPACQCPDHAGGVAVHCSARGLQEIPRDIPTEAVLLKLDANKISRIPNGAFQHLQQLRELDLSHNAIETIGPTAFSGLAGGLRLLDLSHNGIRRIPKDALGKLSAKIRLSHNPLHCECALQEALWELKLDPDSVDEISCHTSAQDEFVGRPLIQVLDSGVSFCSTHHKTTDVAMLVTMFGWFAMVITYIVYYVRHNQEDARRHLEYLKSLPSAPVSKDPVGSAP
nr:leucine-rich repeat-containing protein 3 isoform X1 [Ictidomys tridecemlineatus]